MAPLATLAAVPAAENMRIDPVVPSLLLPESRDRTPPFCAAPVAAPAAINVEEPVPLLEEPGLT